MKKIMNEPEQIIHEMLDGLTSAYPEK
ncbi:hypothetical protein D479_02087 [Halobacillus sp. BAB-2008]|nr:hypothetical protein D479_02087 [Halobacillus sp. BAB-2008]